MTSKVSFSVFLLIVILGLFSACEKDNNGTQEPIEPDTPDVTNQIPPIDEYMPERLLHLFDSLNVLHRGDEPPTINGNFMAESMYLLIVDKVPESNYLSAPCPLPTPRYYEFKEQEGNTFHLTYKNPIDTSTQPFIFIEKSDTDSTYFRIKDNIALFTNDPIAPPYFKSSVFKAEDFKHAYIIGNGNYFTLYFYEIRDTISNGLPLNAVLISGKLATDEEGNTIIEDFWYGIETMKYYNESLTLNLIIQSGSLPTPGDIIIIQCQNMLIEGSYHD